MSAPYVVTYELHESGKAYDELIEELKLSPGYCHTLQSTWLISTEETVRQSYKRLLPCIYEQDRILVTEVSAGIHGRLPGEALEWIGEHR
jgi:hypothetical protein